MGTELPRRVGADRIRIPVALTGGGAADGAQLEGAAEIGPDDPGYARWHAYLLGQERDVLAATNKAADAGDADPKAQASGTPTPPADERWPAWAVDVALAGLAADALTDVMLAALVPFGGPAGLAAMFHQWADGQDHALISRDAVLGWLRSLRVRFDIGAIIRNAITQAAAAGSRSAAIVLAAGPDQSPRMREPGFLFNVDWGGWTPGNVDAARQVLSADGMDVWLGQLLDQWGVRIDSIAANRLDEVAAVLADGLERGASMHEIATGLRGVLDNRSWAQMVAWTETNRATSAAAMETYRRRDVSGVEWFTAMDQRVCARCGANEAAGPVVLGMAFPSGEIAPPAHPRCRCALLPVATMPDDGIVPS